MQYVYNKNSCNAIRGQMLVSHFLLPRHKHKHKPARIRQGGHQISGSVRTRGTKMAAQQFTDTRPTLTKIHYTLILPEMLTCKWHVQWAEMCAHIGILAITCTLNVFGSPCTYELLVYKTMSHWNFYMRYSRNYEQSPCTQFAEQHAHTRYNAISALFSYPPV